MKLAQIKVEIDQKLDLDLTEWAKSEGRSKRRHASVLQERLIRLRLRGSDALGRMPAAELLRELDLVR